MLVKIAAFTSIIQLNLFEMMKLYFFMLPDLLFYTLPITFFISAVMTVSKLSFDYEMIVIFSLGVKPSKIVLFFTKLALVQSLLLILIFFVITPHTNNLSKNFIINKKTEAKFNIKASEYGHKFGNWLIFVSGSADKKDSKAEEDGKFENVILFNQTEEDETLIIAKSADVITKEDVLKLELTQGKGFTYSAESLSQMKFRRMRINDTSDADTEKYKNTWQFWFGDKEEQKAYAPGNKKDYTTEDKYYYTQYQHRYEVKLQKIATLSLISLFPLVSVLFILSIGVINARHQKGFTYLFIFLIVLVYYVAVFTLSKVLGLYTVALLVPATLAISAFIYNKKIAKRY